MKKTFLPTRPFLAILSALLSLSISWTVAVIPAHAQSQFYTEPHGYIKISIAPGTGVAKKTTLFSVPLLDDVPITGLPGGKITALTSRTMTAQGAGWSPGQLSDPSTPFLMEITSGRAAGRMFLVSTSVPNTTETLTIASSENDDLTSLGIASGTQTGDTYRIRPVDTLGSLLGTPQETGIVGGASPAVADTVTIVANGSSSTYYYNTSSTPPRWARVSLGSPDATNVPLPPYAAVQYSRLAPTPLEFFVTGKVPLSRRQVSIKNTGITLMSPQWPVDQTLSKFGLGNVENWKTSPSSRLADNVVLILNGITSTYFHDGKNWRRTTLGSPLADDTVIPAASGIMIIRKGQNSGYDSYSGYPPYNLE